MRKRFLLALSFSGILFGFATFSQAAIIIAPAPDSTQFNAGDIQWVLSIEKPEDAKVTLSLCTPSVADPRVCPRPNLLQSTMELPTFKAQLAVNFGQSDADYLLKRLYPEQFGNAPLKLFFSDVTNVFTKENATDPLVPGLSQVMANFPKVAALAPLPNSGPFACKITCGCAYKLRRRDPEFTPCFRSNERDAAYGIGYSSNHTVEMTKTVMFADYREAAGEMAGFCAEREVVSDGPYSEIIYRIPAAIGGGRLECVSTVK